MTELKEHAKAIKAKALEMFVNPATTLENIDTIYKMLEISEKVMETVEDDPTKDYIKDELQGAEEYLTMYEETHDVDYLEFAHDEANHARKFILQSQADGNGVDSMLDWHKSIVERIGRLSN